MLRIIILLILMSSAHRFSYSSDAVQERSAHTSTALTYKPTQLTLRNRVAEQSSDNTQNYVKSAPDDANPAGAPGAPGAPGGGGPPAPPNTTSNRRLQQTQAQVEEVVDIMRVNVDKVLERDQKLSELDDRADALQAGASQFESCAAKLKNKYWWKNCKMMIIMGVIGVIFIGIIFLYFFS
ncbi:synaptobrevin-like [Garra rufa]|uniref:synaptobrevin-like n=1 Tax=Garra rufa TaxID=137080 RepID=UPI003CCEA178